MRGVGPCCSYCSPLSCWRTCDGAHGRDGRRCSPVGPRTLLLELRPPPDAALQPARVTVPRLILGRAAACVKGPGPAGCWHVGCKLVVAQHDVFHLSRSDPMRVTQLVAAAAAAALTLTACAGGISVRTALSPDASLHGLRTVRVLPTPQPKIAGAGSSTNDPMLVKSISYRALRSDLAQELSGPGHLAARTNPQFFI